MVNRQKIITMTKLALYDKHEGASDRAANDYFRHDYIYKKNLGTRISVGIGGFIVLLIYWLRVILVDGVDVFDLDIQYHATDSVLFIIALIAVYSLIGTVQGTREYYLVQKRLNQYLGMLRFLESGDEYNTAPRPAEELPARESSRERGDRERADRPPTPARPAPRDIPRGTLKDLPREPKDDPPDPLANVSARALAGSRPVKPIAQRPPRPKTPLPVLRFSDDPKDKPIITKTPEE